jgi:peptidoglycan-associated lipoprotein
MQLVGHADPRGSDTYNYALGQRRAESVKLAMLGLGMQSSQVSASSRGKQDAIGSNEAGWAKDRRVEAKLGR